MRLRAVAVACSVCCLLTGCEEQMSKEQASRTLDIELVHTINNIGLENAIIAQHTFYPYHFVPDGAELNSLGQRDFAVLAAHLQKHRGVLNVRHGAVPADLYAARVVRIAEQLKAAGVPADRVKIADEMPGGSGMSSERVVKILMEDEDKTTTRQEPAGADQQRAAP